MIGVVKLFDPKNNAVPPEVPAYQSIVSPPPGVADIVTVPVPHLELLTGVFGAAGAAFTIKVSDSPKLNGDKVL
jgi:hypothetical protein